jgi:betaine-aldehyde dehydrogenase
MNDRMYINGEFVEASNRQTRDIYNPATGEAIAQTPEATPADVEKAIQSARRAFDEGAWREATAQHRGRILFRIAEAVKANTAELAKRIRIRHCGHCDVL